MPYCIGILCIGFRQDIFAYNSNHPPFTKNLRDVQQSNIIVYNLIKDIYNYNDSAAFSDRFGVSDSVETGGKKYEIKSDVYKKKTHKRKHCVHII